MKEIEVHDVKEVPPSFGLHRWTLQVMLAVLFFFSGAAGLGYQVIWIRMFTAGMGHELPALLVVASACLGGMALGAWMLDGVLARTYQPGRWYAGLEWGLAASAAATPFLLPLAMRIVFVPTGAASHRAGFMIWVVPLLILMPTSFCLGASLPAMDRFLTPWTRQKRCVGLIYALNSLGAAIGVLGVLHLLVPLAGFRNSIWILAIINLGVGVGAWKLGRIPASLFLESCAVAPVNVSRARLLVMAAATGCLGLGFEWAAVRALGQVLENTLYTSAALLAVYLLATALGAALFQRYAQRLPTRALLSGLLLALGTLVIVSLFAMTAAGSFYGGLRALLGGSRLSVLVSELCAAGLVLGPPALCMGALFSHLAQTARNEEGGVGRVLSLNLLGGAAAGWLLGSWLMPWLGLHWTVLLLAVAYLLLLPWPLGPLRRWLLVPVAALLLHILLPWSLVLLPEGRTLLALREGRLATVAVAQDELAHRALQVNNRFQMGGTAAAVSERLQAHLPLLLHAHPRTVLFLGVGTGITMEGATMHPDVRATGVELLREAVELMPWFQPYNQHVLDRSNVQVRIGDARRYIRSQPGAYDVIVADLFHPARDGAGFLYTRDHYEGIRQRLQPHGLFCQWIPLGQVDRPVLDIQIRTFLDVFPDAHAWLLRFNVDAPVLGLMSRMPAGPYPDDWIEQRSGHVRLREELKSMSLGDSVRFFGHHLTGPEALARYCGPGPVATDDWPLVSFLAPEFSARPDADSHGRLMMLIQELRLLKKEVAIGLEQSGLSSAMQIRLDAFSRARDVYLEGLVLDGQGRREAATEAYLSSARYSPDFTPGYARCLSLASLLAEHDPAASQRLLERLEKVQPDNPVAGQLRSRLFPGD